MGSIMGYEYECRFSMVDKDEIEESSDLVPTGEDGKYLLLQTRANFILRGEGGVPDVILDSERYNSCAWLPKNHGETDRHRQRERLRHLLTQRLRDYWMIDDEIKRLCLEAFNFATKKLDDPQHASLDVIPVVVELNVCTAQQEGESIDACRNRVIMAEYLVPLYLWPRPYPQALGGMERQPPLDRDHATALMGLRRRRVVNVDSALMRGCRICLRNASVGAQISVLPCYHAFHSHCIVRWLECNNLCPVCYSPAYDGTPQANSIRYI